MSERNVSVIIPAFNEAEIINKTLACLNFKEIKEIIVVNDGSTDHTLDIVKQYPVRLINLNQNRGKGYAVTQGLKWARGDFIMLIDADLGESVAEMQSLIKPVTDGKADLALAVIKIKGGGLGLVRKLAAFGLKMVTGKIIKAPLSGQRIFSRKLVEIITPLSAGFGLELGMDIDLLRNNCRFVELETKICHRVTEKNFTGYYHRGQQLLAILKTLLIKF